MKNVCAGLLVCGLMLGAVSSAAAQYRPEREDGQSFAQNNYQRPYGRDRSSERDGRFGPTRNEPGKFDFYVLALSWSPSFCEAARERTPDRVPRQCTERPYSFVVHGLWPQYERGFPRACQVPAPRLNRGIVDSMLDIMPSPRLVYNQWDNHGTCSGLDANSYFDAVRKARETIRIPDQFRDAPAATVTPQEVEEAFTQANPGLTRTSIAVSCDQSRMTEVRICMSKDLRFRECPEVDGRACRRERLSMPAVRGG